MKKGFTAVKYQAMAEPVTLTPSPPRVADGDVHSAKKSGVILFNCAGLSNYL